MGLEQIIILIVVGLVAGWLAGLIMRGGGFGFIGNLVVGIIGSFIGSFLFRTFNIAFFFVNGIVTQIIIALVGAIILLVIVNLIKRR